MKKGKMFERGIGFAPDITQLGIEPCTDRNVIKQWYKDHDKRLTDKEIDDIMDGMGI